MAAKTTAAKTLKSCACSAFEFGTYDPETQQDDTYTTECAQTTHRIFAQGHDAKLVGYLVRAELAGEEISLTDGGVRTSFSGAVSAAARISEALAAKAEYQLAAAKARLAKKAAAAARKDQRKAARKVEAVEEAPVLADRPAKVKVGRWTYDAMISPNGIASFTKKLTGEQVSIARGGYQEV